MYDGDRDTVRSQGLGRGMYVCMYVRRYVHTMYGMQCGIYLLISASLTLSLAARSAPFSSSSEQVAVWPLEAALWRGVDPYYNNRETETETDRSGQIRDTQEQQEGQSQEAGQVRVGYGTVQQDKVLGQVSVGYTVR